MLKALFLGFLLVVACIAEGWAIPVGTYQPATIGTFVDRSSGSVSTTAVQVMPNNNSRRYLFIQNISNVNIGCSATSVTPAIGTAGTFTLTPNGTFIMETSYIASSPIYCIAASGTNAITAYEGY